MADLTENTIADVGRGTPSLRSTAESLSALERINQRLLHARRRHEAKTIQALVLRAFLLVPLGDLITAVAEDVALNNTTVIGKQ